MAKSRYDELRAACDAAESSGDFREAMETANELQQAIHEAANWTGLTDTVARTRGQLEQLITRIQDRGLLKHPEIRPLYDCAQERLDQAEEAMVDGRDRQVAEGFLAESEAASARAIQLIQGMQQ